MNFTRLKQWFFRQNKESNRGRDIADTSPPPPSPASLPAGHRWTPDGIRHLFRASADFKMEQYVLGPSEHPVPVYMLYCEGMAETKQINLFVLPLLERIIGEESLGFALQHKLNVEQLAKPMDIVQAVFSGQLVLYFESLNEVYSLDVADPPRRQPEESNTEISIKGPRDGFVEDLLSNVALVRKRLRNSSLCYEQFIIGKRSRSKVALLYIADITQPRFVDEARRRLQKIDVDILYSSSQLEEIMSDYSLSMFPLLDYTTRPDFVVDSLVRGRFAVIVDGAPIAIIGPANLTLLLRSPEDAYLPFYISTFGLLFRFAGLIISLLLPGFWAALASYNVEQLPYPLLATIAVSRVGLPLPSPLEAFIMLGMFELFREAGERLPKAVGTTVAVVGGIIVGDAAIRAGLASTTFLVISAVTAVASFTLVNQSLVGSVSIIRLFVLLCGSVLGMYGFMLSTIGVILYLSKLQSFGVPYLSPISPVNWRDFFSAIIRKPWYLKKRRADILQTIDSTRKEGER